MSTRAPLNRLHTFLKNRSGSPAVVFAVALPVVAAVVGGATDLGRTIEWRQRMANTVEQTCQATTLVLQEKMTAGEGFSLVGTVVNTVNVVTSLVGITVELGNKYGKQQNFADGTLTVTAVPVDDTMKITAAATVPLYFGKIIGLPNQALTIAQKCRSPDVTVASAQPKLIFAESFETNHSIPYNGWDVFANWNGWKTANAGIEVNGIPALSGDQILFGNYFAELDSHCWVSNCSSQSSMTREFDLVPGEYVLSYWYISRIRNPAYGSQVICGADSDVAWANWQNQTNRINVSFGQQGKTAKQIDVCVHTNSWVERRQRITVTKKAKYELTFAAAGQMDTVGGLLDYIRFCQNECP